MPPTDDSLAPAGPLRHDGWDGLSLGLLIVIAQILCGCAWTLWRVCPFAIGPEQSIATEQGDFPIQEQYADLFLHDMVIGVLHLQDNDAPELWLTTDQARALMPLRLEIRDRLKTGNKGRDRLDTRLRSVLNDDQMRAMRNAMKERRGSVPDDLSPYANRFTALVETVAARHLEPSPARSRPPRLKGQVAPAAPGRNEPSSPAPALPLPAKTLPTP